MPNLSHLIPTRQVCRLIVQTQLCSSMGLERRHSSPASSTGDASRLQSLLSELEGEEEGIHAAVLQLPSGV